MLEHIQASLEEARQALDQLQKNRATHEAIAQAARLMIDCFRAKGHVYSCGNGGSMCDAMHFAEELSGRYRDNRAGLGAMAMGDGAHITCTGNDFGYEAIFSRFVEAQGRSGDVLVGISTSGKSPNVIKAAEAARALGMKVVTLTGKPESALGRLADVDICTPGGRYADRVQELHIKVIHTLIELIERDLFPDNYTKR
jgi:D-sedoheptulose 7-phosphate isomerase